NLNETRQAEIRKECLRLWGIPDKARIAPSTMDPKSKFSELIQGTDMETFGYKPTLLSAQVIEKISHVLDYRCMVAGGQQYFLLGMGVSYCESPNGPLDSSCWSFHTTTLAVFTNIPGAPYSMVFPSERISAQGQHQGV
ncbi:hypothetical protein chiPu_0025730, partial [Chiloscyllium punctatum]|nr:hypothetical protein [Chiloscyllium punctatum]